MKKEVNFLPIQNFQNSIHITGSYSPMTMNNIKTKLKYLIIYLNITQLFSFEQNKQKPDFFTFLPIHPPPENPHTQPIQSHTHTHGESHGTRPSLGPRLFRGPQYVYMLSRHVRNGWGCFDYFSGGLYSRGIPPRREMKNRGYSLSHSVFQGSERNREGGWRENYGAEARNRSILGKRLLEKRGRLIDK